VPVALKNAHDDPLASHGGVHKTLERLRRYYYWPGWVKGVKEYIRSCDTCKMNKAPNQALRPPMGKVSESARAFQKQDPEVVILGSLLCWITTDNR